MLDRLRTYRIILHEEDKCLHVISFIGFKGGIGRTTGAAALSVGFAALGMRVAAIDAGFAVPLDEKDCPKFDGLGGLPSVGQLRHLIEERPLALSSESSPLSRRVASTAYFEDVIEDLRRAGCSHVVVDTPAHQVPVVFASASRSSLLIVPIREPADVPYVTASVEGDFVAASGNLRFLISGTLQPREIRHLLHPRTVLNTELPHCLFTSAGNDSPIVGQSHDEGWQDECVSLAREVLEILEDD